MSAIAPPVTAQPADPRPVRRFHFKRTADNHFPGKHVQTDPDGIERVYCGRPRNQMTEEELMAGQIPNGNQDPKLGELRPPTVILSRTDLARRYPEKFEVVVDDDLPRSSHIWDSTKETLEEFSARMRAVAGMGGAATVQGGPAQHPSPAALTHPQQAAPPPGAPLGAPGVIDSLKAPAHAPITGKAGLDPTEAKELLESMTVQELQKMAAEEEVDVRSAKTKEALVKVLLTANVV
jgi:hypothetical protein